MDEAVNYEALHYQCSHSHPIHFTLVLDTGVPFMGTPCTAAVTECPRGRRRLCDKILKDNTTGKYHFFLYKYLSTVNFVLSR
jgi:hypothetical protein